MSSRLVISIGERLYVGTETVVYFQTRIRSRYDIVLDNRLSYSRIGADRVEIEMLVHTDISIGVFDTGLGNTECIQTGCLSVRCAVGCRNVVLY